MYEGPRGSSGEVGSLLGTWVRAFLSVCLRLKHNKHNVVLAFVYAVHKEIVNKEIVTEKVLFSQDLDPFDLILFSP